MGRECKSSSNGCSQGVCGHQANAADKRRRLPLVHAAFLNGEGALTSRNAQHSTRARLLRWWESIVVLQGSVLPGVNGIDRYQYGVPATHQTMPGYKLGCGTTINTFGYLSYLRSINNTFGGLIAVVSTWKMIRSSILVSAFVTSSSTRKRLSHRRARANLSWAGLHRSRCTAAVLLCTSSTRHETAHVPSSCALKRAPIAGYVCSPHGMLMLLVRSGCRGSGQSRAFPRS